MVKEMLINNFQKIYGNNLNDIRFYFAPGRVNLIGEHIDYNGGHVFPYAINKGTYVIAKKRSDAQIRFYSLNLKEKPFVYESLYYDEKIEPEYRWVNYPKSTIAMVRKAGYKIDSGFDIIYYGNIPGSGLSSSASIEVVIATMLDDLFNLNMDKRAMAKICQSVENVCYGLKTGIMDQCAVIFGKRDNAIFLDCATLEYEYAPINLGNYKIVVTNSNVPHSLASSKYNERKSQCEEALADLQKVVKINHLCELSVEEFNKFKEYIKDDTCRTRAKYVVEEEARTKYALKSLKENNLEEFVKQINASGKGLKDEYEATVEQIDFLVEKSLSYSYCIGSRMTGGGWGGNIIAIVEKDKTSKYMFDLKEEYKKKYGIDARSNILDCADGARRLEGDSF